MAVQHQTRCPHCGAQFKISEDHLKQAGGAVRCGSCLEVFQANEHLVQTAPEKPAAKPQSGLSEEDEAWADSILKKLESGKQTPRQTAPQTPQQEPQQPAQQPAAPAQPPQNEEPQWQPPQAAEEPQWSPPQEEEASAAPEMEDSDDAFVFDEDEFADLEAGIIDEDEDDESTGNDNDTSVSLGSLELSDSLLSLGDDNNDAEDSLSEESFSDMAGAGRGNSADRDADESWAEALLEELDEDAQQPQEPKAAKQQPDKQPEPPKQNKPTPTSASPVDEDLPADFIDDDAEDFFASADIEGLDDDDDELGAIEIPDADTDDEIKIKRPRISIDPDKINWLDVAQWGGVSLLLLAVLAVQYLAFNFDRLARTPDWRSFYSSICQTAGCTLPNPSDIRYIRGSNLVVRSHPTFGSALVVDAILFNEANYEQPFPVLELTFTNIHGRPVAQRKFQPEEYLHGDLSGRSTMSPNIPMHISFEILDPGESAVNYNLRFYPLGEAG